MTCAPVLHLAIGLLISSEMIAPPKPITAEKTSSALRFSPLAVEEAVQAEHVDDDAQHHHHGQVGDEEQDDAFHGVRSE